MFGCELSATVFAKPYLSDSHQLRFSKTFFLAAMAAAKNAGRRSSSWHDYHLYGTSERLLYIKVSIRETASDTLRVRFEWNLSEYVCMYVFSFLLLLLLKDDIYKSI